MIENLGGYYLLDKDRNVVPAKDVLEWAEGFDEDARRVGYDENSRYRISTVFLGLDHRFGGEGPPLVFETMVFEKLPLWKSWLLYLFPRLSWHYYWSQWSDIECERCSTWAEAEAQHAKWLAAYS